MWYNIVIKSQYTIIRKELYSHVTKTETAFTK